jgi:hypothetical protein
MTISSPTKKSRPSLRKPAYEKIRLCEEHSDEAILIFFLVILNEVKDLINNEAKERFFAKTIEWTKPASITEAGLRKNLSLRRT